MGVVHHYHQSLNLVELLRVAEPLVKSIVQISIRLGELSVVAMLLEQVEEVEVVVFDRSDNQRVDGFLPLVFDSVLITELELRQCVLFKSSSYPLAHHDVPIPS